MEQQNIVFIARSLDGYIADKHGKLDWLESIPNPEGIDMGYTALMERVDALVMGRTTFETVCGFDIDWPYTKPVFVLSNTLKSIPEDYSEKAILVNGPLGSVLDRIHAKGYNTLYIDGGKVIQSFLKEDLIDELIISTIPILLGGGTPLFGDLEQHLSWEHQSTDVYLNAITQGHYKRKR